MVFEVFRIVLTYGKNNEGIQNPGGSPRYVSEKIKEFEETGYRKFLIGHEESCGYLIGDFVRDNDAVQTCLLIAEAAAYYKTENLNLYAGLSFTWSEGRSVGGRY